MSTLGQQGGSSPHSHSGIQPDGAATISKIPVTVPKGKSTGKDLTSAVESSGLEVKHHFLS